MPLAFPELFERLSARNGEPGFSPFRWQTRLYDLLAGGDLPSALDLPTGLGKTSAMMVWLAARAVNPKLPRRLVYVVDRRAVVDQASEEAGRIADNINADAELKAELGLSAPLAVTALRGRLADNRAWLNDPAAPAVIVGTVDMIGSRLLFSGYGVSRAQRPIHAGLLGCDSLFMLDEAHLSRPFQRLVEALAADDQLWPDRSAPRLKVLALSATGAAPDAASSGVFRLDPSDREDPEIMRRLSAHKALVLEDCAGKVVETMAAAAVDLVGRATAPLCLAIFVTSRTEAQKLHDLLSNPGNGIADAGLHLLTGARRGAERDQVARDLEEAGLLAGGKCSGRHEILIATSAGEVGIDLDADHMLCDLVSWERLVQRLGRVNRRGNGRATVRIFDFGDKGMGLSKEFKEAELERRANVRALFETLPETVGGRDGSPSALGAVDGARARAASTPEPLRPGLALPLAEAWSLTGLPSHAGRPEVGPWLRGWVNDEPQASLAWRRYLPVLRGEGRADVAEPRLVAEYFDAAPVSGAELLEMDAGPALAILGARAKTMLQKQLAVDGRRIVGLLLGHDGALREAVTLSALAEENIGGRGRGATALGAGRLILDAEFGGLDAGLLAKTVDTAPATADAPDAWAALIDAAAHDARLPGWQVARCAGDAAPAAGSIFSMDVETGSDGAVQARLEVTRLVAQPSTAAPWLSSTPVLLAVHEEAVAAEARRIAAALLDDPAQIEAIARAGALHDHGKASRLWQSRMGAPRDGIYAKTTGRAGRGLDGYRHEFGSLLAAEREDLPAETRDLILHLIAAHHGHARPGISISAVEPAEGGAFGQLGGLPSQLERAARDVALRFAALQLRYGPWGLAWREEMLRAADRAVSRREAEAEAKAGDGGSPAERAA